MSILILRWLHLVAVLGFVAAHGATAAVTFRLRREREPSRIRAMLDLSRSTRTLMYSSFTVLVLSGVGLGFHGNWWQSGWIWTSTALLAVLFGAAFPLAVPYFRAIRQAAEREPPDLPELGRLVASPRGLWLAWIETLGILAIVALMVFKPF